MGYLSRKKDIKKNIIKKRYMEDEEEQLGEIKISWFVIAMFITLTIIIMFGMSFMFGLFLL